MKASYNLKAFRIYDILYIRDLNFIKTLKTQKLTNSGQTHKIGNY